MRAAGGHVLWIQTTATGALEHWGNHHKYMLTPERAAKRLASLDESAEGFNLYPALDRTLPCFGLSGCFCWGWADYVVITLCK